jgi:hypothetical protein
LPSSTCSSTTSFDGTTDYCVTLSYRR